MSRLSTNAKNVAQTNCRNRTVVTTYQYAVKRKAYKLINISCLYAYEMRYRCVTTQLPSSVLTLMV